MKLEANAKVNIGLLVGDRRSDGFHNIETIMARISLSDTLDFSLSPSSSFSVAISGNEGYLKEGIDLMEKAAAVFYNLTGIGFSLFISIDKKIPSEAGLGGGSSDAAAVFSYLDEFFGFPIPKEELIAASVLIGSDVPFFVSGFNGALVSGKGEIVSECPVPRGHCVLLSIPRTGIKTGDAYASLDAMPLKNRKLPIGSFPSRMTHPNDFELVSPVSFSDVFPPEIILSDAYISLTGSGSAWFALFPEKGVVKFDNPEKYDIVSAYII